MISKLDAAEWTTIVMDAIAQAESSGQISSKYAFELYELNRKMNLQKHENVNIIAVSAIRI